jgi:hypothetical protein
METTIETHIWKLRTILANYAEEPNYKECEFGR